MRGGVYLHFGHTTLTTRSFEDLRRLEIEPRDGLGLTFCDRESEDTAEYLQAEGVLYIEDGRWRAHLDTATMRAETEG